MTKKEEFTIKDSLAIQREILRLQSYIDSRDGDDCDEALAQMYELQKKLHRVHVALYG